MAGIHSYGDAVNFYQVDEHAGKATPNDYKTFPALISYLQKCVQVVNSANYTELQLVRGVLVWIAVNQRNSANAGYNTPLGVVQAIVERRLSAVEAFSTFLGYTSVEHTTIQGRAKAVRYRAGDPDNEYLRNHPWMAFKADDKWHLVHPQWAIHKYVGYEAGDEIKIQQDGKADGRLVTHQMGVSMYGVSDFWFCTRPDIFVNRCFPDDPRWQTPNSKTPIIKSVSEFLAMPDYRTGFYCMNFSLLSEKKCVLTSDNGKCYITIMVDDRNASRIDFSYELAMLATGSRPLKTDDLKQLVLPQIRNKTTFVFEVRLPVIGTYWLRLSAGYFDSPTKHKQNCCQFKIVCNKVTTDCHLYPTTHGLGLFGLGPHAVDAGLDHPSVPGSKLKVNPSGKTTQKKTVLAFKTDDDPNREMEYQAVMYGSDSVDGNQITITMADNAEAVVDKDRGKILVNANVPMDGEYSLVVNARDKKDKKQKKYAPAACYYVVTQEDEYDKQNNQDIRKQQQQARLLKNIEKKEIIKKEYETRADDVKKEIEALKRATKGAV